MKIIITDFFIKQYSKIVTDIDINDFIKKINVNSKDFINLKEPYIKLKTRTKNKSYRSLIIFDKNEVVLLMINVFDKKDKLYGENLNWSLHKKNILEWQKNNEECIKSGKYYTVLL